MTITIRKASEAELERYTQRYGPHVAAAIESAESLFEASQLYRGELTAYDVDASDAILAMSAGLMNGTLERFSGKSHSGVHSTIERMNPYLTAVNPSFLLVKISNLNAFGFPNSSVYATCLVTTDSLEVQPASLFSSEFERIFMYEYIMSPHCRAEDAEEVLHMLRGKYAAHLMGLYKPSSDEVTNNIRPTRGTDYSMSLAHLFETERSAFESAVLHDLKRSSVLDKPKTSLPFDEINRILANFANPKSTFFDQLNFAATIVYEHQLNPERHKRYFPDEIEE